MDNLYSLVLRHQTSLLWEILGIIAQIFPIIPFLETAPQALAAMFPPLQPAGIVQVEQPYLPLQFAGQKTRPEAIASGLLSEVADAGSINRSSIGI